MRLHAFAHYWGLRSPFALPSCQKFATTKKTIAGASSFRLKFVFVFFSFRPHTQMHTQINSYTYIHSNIHSIYPHIYTHMHTYAYIHGNVLDSFYANVNIRTRGKKIMGSIARLSFWWENEVNERTEEGALLLDPGLE